MDDSIADEVDATGDIDVTGDEPATAARGPRVPDVLADVSFGVWIFGLLALARLVWFVREAQLGPEPGLSTLVAYGSALVPAVVAILLPAALLLRHPDAWWSARTLLVGTILFALVEGLRVLSPLLGPFFEQVTPGSDETPYLVPLAIVYSSIQGLLTIFAVANIGLGLAQSRRYLDRTGARLIGGVAVLVVFFSAAARLVTVSRLPFDEIPMTPTMAAYLASAIVLGTLSIGAWGYLAATVGRGARAGEEPEVGWTIGAFGVWLVVAAYAANGAANLAEPTPETQAVFNALSQVITVTFALGHLGLVGALLLGMPSLKPLEDDDFDDDAEETEDGDAYGVTEIAPDPWRDLGAEGRGRHAAPTEGSPG